MRPRLKSAPLTQEDLEILWAGYRDIPTPAGLPERTPVWKGVLAGVAMLERDADLMFDLCWRYGRKESWERYYPGVRHATFAFQGLATAELVLE